MHPKIEDALRQASKREFWGKVEITFKAGEPVLITTTTTTPIDRQEGGSSSGNSNKHFDR